MHTLLFDPQAEIYIIERNRKRMFIKAPNVIKN